MASWKQLPYYVLKGNFKLMAEVKKHNQDLLVVEDEFAWESKEVKVKMKVILDI